MSKILAGLTLCCTAIDPDKRNDVAQKWKSMGGLHTLDLIESVTHLIVGRLNTEKYKFAVKNRPDITLLCIESVLNLYDLWIQGNSIPPAVNDQLCLYKLPPLYNLHICVTNIPFSQRVEIQHLITQNGGIYCPDLTKNVDILLASEKSGTKYSYALSWNIKILDPIWLYRCLERGAALMTDDADDDSKVASPDAASPHPSAPPPTRTTLLPLVSKKRKKTSSSRILDNILSGVDKINVPVNNTNNSSTSTTTTTPFNLVEQQQQQQQDDNTQSHQIFSNLTFCCCSFSAHQQRILDKAITSNGGQIIDREKLPSSSFPDYCIVNSSSSSKPPPLNPRTKVVTEWFIERCLYKNVLVDADSDIWSNPVPELKPIPIFSQLSFCISGYSGIELTHMTKLIQRLGGHVVQILDRNVGVLVAIPGQSNRIQFARHCHVPVVNGDFIWECARTGGVVAAANEDEVVDLRQRAAKLSLDTTTTSKQHQQPRKSKRYFSEFDFAESHQDSSTTSAPPAGDTTTTTTDNDDVSSLNHQANSSSSSSSRRSRGRLVGRRTIATTSSTTTTQQQPPPPPPPPVEENDSTTDAPESSQSTVSYAYPIAQREKQKMLKKLGDL